MATVEEPRARHPVAAVALPAEHGGWSLTFEPVLLGLVVAWSGPGLALGAAAMLAFVARTPLKVVLVDRWRHRWLGRTRLAARVVAIEILAIVALAAIVTRSGPARLWLPLAAAAPLILLELWFDMRSRSRRLVPELAGTIGIGSVAAAIVLADRSDTALALGMWCVVSARAAAAIPYVRAQLQRLHRRPPAVRASDLAQVLSVVAVAAAWALDAAPLAALVAVAVVAGLNIVGLRRPQRPVVVLGLTQMVLGLAVIAVTAIAVLSR